MILNSSNELNNDLNSTMVLYFTNIYIYMYMYIVNDTFHGLPLEKKVSQ